MEVLKKLAQCGSVSGEEQAISALISEELSEFEQYTDALGNLIVHKKGTGKTILFAAHMDEIGIMVTYLEKNGFLRFSNIGGLYTKDLLGRRVRFANGRIGVIGTESENKNRTMGKMYIDIGAESKEEAEKIVSVGDTAYFVGDFVDQGHTILSKALDNRAGCYALIRAAKEIKTENDLYFVFTVQEEVGLRGARTAAFGIDADKTVDYAIAVDVTDTGDTPNGEKMAVSLGKGAAIKVMDHSVICDHTVRETLVALAKEKNIPYQLEIMTDGGTDAGTIHLTRGGIRTGGISIPTRYIHSPSELLDKCDLNAVIALIKAFAENKREK